MTTIMLRKMRKINKWWYELRDTDKIEIYDELEDVYTDVVKVKKR